jgi:hypothetical protein
MELIKMTILVSIITGKQLRPKVALALAVLLTSIIAVSQIDGRPVMMTMMANTMVQQASATMSSASTPSSSSAVSSYYYRYNYAYSTDATTTSNAYVHIQAKNDDHPPIAYGQSILTTQNTPVGIHLSAADSDSGDIITSFAIVSMPGRGAITNFDQSSGTLTYTPYAGSGTTATTDSFTFDVIDNHGTISKTGVVSITISPGPH